MNGKFLLDTNIIIALFAKDISVQKNLIEVQEVFVPSIVFGELYYAVHKSTRMKTNLARLNKLIVNSAVLSSAILGEE